MRCLVTGASGFVGSNLTRRLLRDGHEVHVLLRQHSDAWRLKDVRPDLHIYGVDLCEKERLVGVVREIRPDWVFHLAAHGAYSWQSDLQRMVQANIVGTINLVEACLETGFEAFVNTGSSSEYGFKDHAPSEMEWLEPNSHYAVTKASATLFCRYTAQTQCVRLPTLRLYSVYGPFEDPTRLMPTLILHGLAGGLPPLVNPGIARDYVYVEDVEEAYLQAATKPNQEPGAVYNIGTGVQTSLREVVDVARKVMGIAAGPKWGSMPDRLWDTSVWVSDNRRANGELDWSPRNTFEVGFEQMVNWFRLNHSLWDFYKNSQRPE